MLETDGFWNAVASIGFWGAMVFMVWKFVPDVRQLIKDKDIKINLGNNGISIQQAASQLSEYVSDLQSRVAVIENKIGGNESYIESIDDPVSERILWVDDYPSNNAVIIEGFRGRSFTIDTVLSTDDAIKRFTALDHKMIITDLGRVEGGIDNPLAGLDLIKLVRRVNHDIPIVVFAGERGLKMKGRLLAAGATAVTSSGYDVVRYINEYMQ